MKYFVLDCSSVSGGAIAKAVTEKDSKDEALMVFHQTRASALSNKNITYALCEVVDESGNVVAKEFTKVDAE